MTNSNDLEISRVLAVPRAKLWKAWSDPKLLAEWWCPKPWKTEVRQFDFRTGGAFYTFMTGPDGNGGQGESDNPGLFLEVTPMERIIGTSCLIEGWRPAKPWMPMTMIITFADEGAGTRYVARVLHQNEEDTQKHVEMGFYDGWNTCITQLEDLAKTL